MALVDYSDSDASDVEEQPVVKSSASSSKAGFQKVVDRSNPGKIRVSLPQSTALREPTYEGAPPAKRAKTSGGTFSGFNSFLPAPKRAGLAKGVNLKTGTAPGFSREPEPEREYTKDENDLCTSDGPSGTDLPQSTTTEALAQTPANEVKLIGKPLMFRPLSVANKSKKKKQNPTIKNTKTSTSEIPTVAAPETPTPRVKLSLFSLTTEPENLPATMSTGDYTPLMIDKAEDGEEDGASPDQSSLTPSYEDYTPNTSFSGHLPPVPTPPVSQSLDDIAGDLNLSAAERRQLFGRQKGGRSKAATNIINFNTDQEYLHNEELRAAGEQVSHNPVRAIAPGKHSLKQLVNAARSQKEALEESFAKGKNNRAEASSRYGW